MKTILRKSSSSRYNDDYVGREGRPEPPERPGQGRPNRPGQGRPERPGQGRPERPGDPGEGRPGHGRPGQGRPGRPGQGRPERPGGPGEGGITSSGDTGSGGENKLCHCVL